MRKSVVAIAIIVLLMPTGGMAYLKSLDITPIAQEEDYYCGVTVIEMWSEWINGYDREQDEIADFLYADDGLTADEMASGLARFSGHSFSRYNSSSQSSFTSVMVSEIYSNEPVAVVANTRRTNGTMRKCGHWLLVDSFEQYSSGYSNNWNNLKGFYMNDPLYGSGFNSYIAITPYSIVSKGDLFSPTVGNPVVSKCATASTQYALVRD